MNAQEARVAVTQILLDRIREDTYPSATHMQMLEDLIPQEMLEEYFEVLLDKVSEERWPSITMLQRIQRVADAL